jgi:MYXO-CTERM domain-containing protein
VSTAGRRLVGAALVACAASAALATAGPDALVPFVALARAAGADTTVAVAFVVDFGGSGGPVVACVKVPTGTSGYQALAEFTAQQSEQAPTYNAAQLLCSINGYPASGCGQAVSGGYDYWSYWHGGSGTWQYANAGAFGAVQAGDVEGWRFENPGRANPSDPPPGAAPAYAAICGSDASAPTGSDPAGPVPAAASGSVPTTAPAGPASPNAGRAATATSVPRAAGTNGSPSTTATSVAEAGASTPPGAQPAGVHPGALGARALAGSADHASGGGPGPAIAGGVLIALLAGLAVWRWRRRPRAP